MGRGTGEGQLSPGHRDVTLSTQIAPWTVTSCVPGVVPGGIVIVPENSPDWPVVTVPIGVPSKYTASGSLAAQPVPWNTTSPATWIAGFSTTMSAVGGYCASPGWTIRLADRWGGVPPVPPLPPVVEPAGRSARPFPIPRGQVLLQVAGDEEVAGAAARR